MTFEVEVTTLELEGRTYVLRDEWVLEYMRHLARNQGEEAIKTIDARIDELRAIRQRKDVMARAKTVTYTLKYPTWDDITKTQDESMRWHEGQAYQHRPTLELHSVARCLVDRKPESLDLPDGFEARLTVIKRDLPPNHISRLYLALERAIESPEDELPFWLQRSIASSNQQEEKGTGDG